MTTLLIIGLTLVAGLLLNTLLLWGIAKLFRVERATLLRATLVVVLMSVAATGMVFGLRMLHTPTTAAAAVLVFAGELVILFLLAWELAWLILHASAGKAVLVALCDLTGSALLGAGMTLGLMQLVATYVVPTNAMAPAIIGYHFGQTCPLCGGYAVVSARPPQGDDDFPERFDEPKNGICTNCRKISEFQNYKGEVHGADRIICNRLLTPARWDKIAFRHPPNPTTRYVSRLVGLPGETIAIKEKAIWINGVKADLPPELDGLEYTSSPLPDTAGDPREWVLGPSDYFVLGDFTTNSSDSRDWGPVPAANIESVVTLVYWPPQRWRILR